MSAVAFAVVDKESASTLSSGSFTKLSDRIIDGSAAPENIRYTDASSWTDGDFPDEFSGFQQVTTGDDSADRTSASATYRTFTASSSCQVWVFHDDAIVTKTGTTVDGWTDGGYDLDVDGKNLSGYYNNYARGDTVTLRGNGGSASDAMFICVVVPVAVSIVPIALANNGFITFASATGSIDEQTTLTEFTNPVTPVKFRRITGTDGAVSVTVYDTLGGTGTSGVDYTAIPDTVFNWADGVLGNQYLDITSLDISADVTIELGFKTLTGGIVAGPDRQTLTVTVNADQASGAVDYVIRAGGGEDYTTIQGFLDDVNSGTVTAPYIAEVEANTPGGSQTFEEACLVTASGTSGNLGILRGKSGDTILITAPTSTQTFNVNGVSYFELGNVTLGDETQWTPQSTSDPNGGYTPLRQLRVTSTSSNCIFRDLTVTGANAGSFPNWIQGSNHYFKDCLFHKHGTNFDQRTPTPGDTGDMVIASSTSTYWDGCTFNLGGHDAIQVRASFQRFMNCVFDNNGWVAVHGDTDYPGSRAMNIAAGKSDESGVASPYGRVSVRKCELVNPGPSQDDGGGQITPRCIDAEGKYIAYYDCIIYEGDAGEGGPIFAHSYPDSNPGFTDHYYVFHNTMYGADHMVDGNAGSKNNRPDQQTDDTLITGGNHKYFNNIMDNLSTVRAIDLRWGQYADLLEVETFYGGTDGWLDHIYEGNIFNATGTIEVAMQYGSGGAGVEDKTLTAAQTDWSTHFNNNQDTAPTFVNASANTRAGFQLSSGAGIGEARALTTMVGAGSSATSGTLADANFFFCRDAYSITTTDCENDSIDINGTTVELLTINYTTGAITFTPAATWSNGDDVALDGFDDIGIGAA